MNLSANMYSFISIQTKQLVQWNCGAGTSHLLLRSNFHSYHPEQKFSFLRVSQVREFVGKENSPSEDVFELSFE